MWCTWRHIEKKNWEPFLTITLSFPLIKQSLSLMMIYNHLSHKFLWIATSEWSRAAPLKIVFIYFFIYFFLSSSTELKRVMERVEPKITKIKNFTHRIRNKTLKKILIYVRYEWNIIVDWGKKHYSLFMHSIVVRMFPHTRFG